MRVDPSSQVPVFKQIADYLRSSIAAGVYRPDEALPSKRVLGMKLGVNPHTVQHAYEDLQKEGLVEARKGSGMYVAESGHRPRTERIASGLVRSSWNGPSALPGRRSFRKIKSEISWIRAYTMIKAENLTKHYRRLVAVDHVNLEIPKGCVFGLIGPNGAGKTTLIKMLMGLTKITAGWANIGGLDVADMADQIHRTVGYVPETHNIYRWMRVGEVIRFSSTFRDTWNEVLCKELLDAFELDPGKKVKHLSKGMLAKLSLLLALAFEPDVLLLDEPTSGLDAVIREEFVDSLLDIISGRECTVLFSSHAIEDVERIADRVGLIFNGQMSLDQPVKDLLSATRRIRAVLKDGCAPKDVPEGTIWQQMDGREWTLTVRNFTAETISRLKSANSLENVETEEISLTQFFKDYVKGRRVKK